VGRDAAPSGDDAQMPTKQHFPPPDARVEVKDASVVDPEAGTDAGGPPPTMDAGDDSSYVDPSTCGLTVCAPKAPCADLVVDRADLLASVVLDTRSFGPNDCGIFEGCVTQTGVRRLLRFDTGVVNVGTADVYVGDPTTGICFQYSTCHQHYHFKGVAVYTLYALDGTTVAAQGHKQSFCLEDQSQSVIDPTPQPANPYTCTNQGLHVGWEDIYPNDIDCQWIDVTDVPPGNYLLSVHVNTTHVLPESNYDNDEERVPVTLN
jgi:hypothetical protein